MVNNGQLELKGRPTDKTRNALLNVRAKVVKEFKSFRGHQIQARDPDAVPGVKGRTYEEDGMTLECVWANRLVRGGWVGSKVHTTYACGRVGGLERNMMRVGAWVSSNV